MLYGQNDFTPKKHSSLHTNSKAGSAVKLHNFKTQNHLRSKTVVLDCKVEILDIEGPFTAKPISETNNSASLFAVHHGKERSVKISSTKKVNTANSAKYKGDYYT